MVVRSPRIALAACLIAAAVAVAASAQAPAPDANEPNDTATTAATLNPGARVAAAVAAGDADWFTFSRDAPAWTEAFMSPGRQRVSIDAERLTKGCSDASLRVTVYVGGQLKTSQPVYPGAQSSILTLDVAINTRYDLLVDTALDPACVAAVAYTLRAAVYTEPPPSIVAASPPGYTNGPACASYRKQIRQLRKRIKHTPKRQRAQIRRLNTGLKIKRRKMRVACG